MQIMLRNTSYLNKLRNEGALSTRVTLINPRTGQWKQVKAGFSWTLLIFSGMFGFPLFLRGLHALGALMLGFWLLNLVAPILALVPIIILQVWLGFSGNRLTAEHLFSQGWQFENPESAESHYAAEKWSILRRDLPQNHQQNQIDEDKSDYKQEGQSSEKREFTYVNFEKKKSKYRVFYVIGFFILALLFIVLLSIGPEEISDDDIGRLNAAVNFEETRESTSESASQWLERTSNVSMGTIQEYEFREMEKTEGFLVDDTLLSASPEFDGGFRNIVKGSNVIIDGESTDGTLYRVKIDGIEEILFVQKDKVAVLQ